MKGILRIIQKRLRMALFLADWSLLIILIKKLLSMRTVRSTISASENNDIENYLCFVIKCLFSRNVLFSILSSILLVVFFFYNDVIMLVQIFSILLILFTWNQVKICFKGWTKFISYRWATSFAENVVILLWVHAFNYMFLQMYMLILIIRF